MRVSASCALAGRRTELLWREAVASGEPLVSETGEDRPRGGGADVVRTRGDVGMEGSSVTTRPRERNPRGTGDGVGAGTVLLLLLRRWRLGRRKREDAALSPSPPLVAARTGREEEGRRS